MSYLYVYAAVAGAVDAAVLAGVPPLPGGSAPRVLGLDRSVSLIVANVPPALYNAETLETRLADLDWVAECGVAHHAVSDALAVASVVLPMRLFTLFSSETIALATLRRSTTAIAAALTRVTGKQEWVLRIGRPDPARLDPATAKTAGIPSGTSFLRAKADARREEAERAQRVTRGAAEVYDTLRGLADAATTRVMEPGDTLLVDAAFLIAATKAEAFQQTLSLTAAGLLRDGCPVSLTGPWPPYSFAAVEDSHG